MRIERRLFSQLKTSPQGGTMFRWKISIVLAIVWTLSFLQIEANAQSVLVTICKQVDASKTVPIDPTDRFGTDQPELHAIAVLKNPGKGTIVKGTWVSVDAIAQPNYPIDSVSVQIQEKGEARAHFALSRPKNGWPVGNYRLDVYVNDKLDATAPFSIK
jgi:hypothetical protein